jgi:hypothetical protein
MSARGRAERLRTFRLAKGLGWAVSSASRRGELYLVRDDAGRLSCSCDGFYRWRVCKHVLKIRDRLAREARRRGTAA